MSDPFVTLARYHDPILAASRKAALEEEGIVVSSPGLEHRSMLGAVGGFIEVPLQVPESQLEAARELLRALDDPDEVESIVPSTPTIGGPYRGGEGDEGYTDAPRKKVVASFVGVVLTFGSAHRYGRESVMSAWLLLLQAGALVGAMSGAVPGVGWSIPLIVLYDVLGGRGAVERFNAGTPRDGAGQLKRLPLPLVLLVLGALAGPSLSELFAEAPPPQTQQ